MCTVTRPNLLADCQLSVVRPRKIGTNHPLQWVVVDIFNDHDFTCQLTLNFDKTLTITVKAKLCSTDTQETRNNVTIKHYGWNAYNQELDSVIISHYETSETINELDEIAPTIKKIIRKIKKLEFKERE